MSIISNRIIVFVLSGTLFWSCGDSGSGPSTDFTEARREIALTIADIARSGYSQLEQSSSALESSAVSFVEQPDVERLVTLRESLHSCRAVWQNVAPLNFGPAEVHLLRSSLNTYPADRDKIESHIESGQYTLGSPGSTGAEGFAAIGYLLYGIDKSDLEVTETFLNDTTGNRKDYLLDLTERISELSESVSAEWQAGSQYGDDFASTEMLGTDVGSALSLTVNAFELHLQRFVRDAKVGIPAGVRSAGVPRPTATEAYYSGRSVEYLIIALQAMQNIYNGNSTLHSGSLYAYLGQLQFGDLADEINIKFDEVIAKSQELNDPLSEQINTNNDPVIEVFLEIQELLPMIKSDMASAMGVIITNQDADGD